MKINQSNIAAFIAHLYRARKGEAPPQAVLDSWQGLSDDEINGHLRSLFESWGYTDAEAVAATDEFLATRQEGPVNVPPPPQAPQSAPPIPPATPPVYEAPKPIYTPPPAPSYAAPTTPPQPQYIPPPPPQKRSRTGLWVIVSILTLLLLVGIYAGYQYGQYSGLKRVFTITDNVAIRNKEGGVVGRMDVYADPAKSSFASLRALDNQEYPLTVDGKDYNFRKVLTDSATFSDYLLHREASTRYVSAGYLTENQGDYQRYRDVFRAINNNAKESARLTAGYRQVIIGSLAAAGNTALYVDNVCNNQRTDLTSVWKYQAPGSKVKVAAARMSDGQYYLFAGNTDTRVYEAPVPLTYSASAQGEQPLQGRDLLFGQDKSGHVNLYECGGSNTSFFATPDGEGKIKTFQWANDPGPAPTTTDTDTYDLSEEE